MKTRDWLRGCKLRVFKKWCKRIYHNGIFYSVKDYPVMLNKAKKLKIGDLIYNPQTGRTDFEIKEVYQEWRNCYSCRVLFMVFPIREIIRYPNMSLNNLKESNMDLNNAKESSYKSRTA